MIQPVSSEGSRGVKRARVRRRCECEEVAGGCGTEETILDEISSIILPAAAMPINQPSNQIKYAYSI
jgi:hypothetical protein